MRQIRLLSKPNITLFESPFVVSVCEANVSNHEHNFLFTLRYIALRAILRANGIKQIFRFCKRYVLFFCFVTSFNIFSMQLEEDDFVYVSGDETFEPSEDSKTQEEQPILRNLVGSVKIRLEFEASNFLRNLEKDLAVADIEQFKKDNLFTFASNSMPGRIRHILESIDSENNSRLTDEQFSDIVDSYVGEFTKNLRDFKLQLDQNISELKREKQKSFNQENTPKREKKCSHFICKCFRNCIKPIR